MALIDLTKNQNHVALSSDAKTAVNTAATAIRAAFAAAAAEKKKENVQKLFMELIRIQDVT